MCFFFSSRRRHTRSLCDWSSDVCSSDLVAVAVLKNQELQEWATSGDGMGRLSPLPKIIFSNSMKSLTSQLTKSLHRSEERRVGKECSCRCGTDHRMKKVRGSELLHRQGQ